LERNFINSEADYGQGQILLFDPTDDPRVANSIIKEKIIIEKNSILSTGLIQGANMFTKREVFEKLAIKYPEKATVNKQLVGNKVEIMKEGWYTFFETAQDPEHGYLGEDIAFCRLWVAMGGKIYADATTALTHFGSHAYTGSLSLMFKPKQVDLTLKP
jgi:hypothetical protein